MMRMMSSLQIAYSESYLHTKFVIIIGKVVPMSLVNHYALKTYRGIEV
jgi:hypothetical protein